MKQKGRVRFFAGVWLSRIQSLGMLGFLALIQKKCLARVCVTESLRNLFLERSIRSLLGEIMRLFIEVRYREYCWKK